MSILNCHFAHSMMSVVLTAEIKTADWTEAFVNSYFFNVRQNFSNLVKKE